MTVNHAMRPQLQTVHRFTLCTAVPEGGACSRKRQWVWGCLIFFSVLAAPVTAQSQTVPSGQSVTLTEVLEDVVGGEDWLRFRFVAPQIARDGGTVTSEIAEADFVHLCDSVARPYLVQYNLSPDVVVISLMDRQVDFGASDSDATQFFEAFRMTEDACVLDVF